MLANNLAWMYLADNERLDEALRLAQSARAKLPQSADVADTLGWAFYKNGSTSQAVRTLEEAVQKSPRNAQINYHLGLAYAKHGDLTRARRVLEQALAMAPDAPEAAEARAVLSGGL